MQPYPPASLPWWRSKIIIGALVSIVMKLLVAFDVAGALSDAETAQITDLVLMAIGAIGDLVAIGSRVRQRYAPPISGGEGAGPGSGGSVPLAAALLLSLMIPLASSATLPPPAAVIRQHG